MSKIYSLNKILGHKIDLYYKVDQHLVRVSWEDKEGKYQYPETPTRLWNNCRKMDPVDFKYVPLPCIKIKNKETPSPDYFFLN